jgi:hypothetical protein
LDSSLKLYFEKRENSAQWLFLLVAFFRSSLPVEVPFSFLFGVVKRGSSRIVSDPPSLSPAVVVFSSLEKRGKELKVPHSLNR